LLLLLRLLRLNYATVGWGKWIDVHVIAKQRRNTLQADAAVALNEYNVHTEPDERMLLGAEADCICCRDGTKTRDNTSDYLPVTRANR